MASGAVRRAEGRSPGTGDSFVRGAKRMELFHHQVSGGYRLCCGAPVDSVKQVVEEHVGYAAKMKAGVVVGLAA